MSVPLKTSLSTSTLKLLLNTQFWLYSIKYCAMANGLGHWIIKPGILCSKKPQASTMVNSDINDKWTIY